MPTVGEIARVSTKEISTEERARKIWEKMRAEALRRKLPKTSNRYGTGYILSGSIASYAAQIWPEMDFSDRRDRKAKAFLVSVYPYMRACGTVVTIETSLVKGKAENRIFVNDVYTDRALIPVAPGSKTRSNADRAALLTGAPTRRAEARLTPHEAGEDREPEPVTVMHVDPEVEAAEAPAPEETPAPAAKQRPKGNPKVPANRICTICDKQFAHFRQRNAHMATHAPGSATYKGTPGARGDVSTQSRALTTKMRTKHVTLNLTSTHTKLPDGSVKCDDCGKTFKDPHAITGHKKLHFNERRNTEIIRLLEENAELRAVKAERVGLDPLTALEAVRSALASATRISEEKAVLNSEKTALLVEVEALKSQLEELKNAPQQVVTSNTDADTQLDMIREIVDRAQRGETQNLFRVVSDISDVLSMTSE